MGVVPRHAALDAANVTHIVTAIVLAITKENLHVPLVDGARIDNWRVIFSLLATFHLIFQLITKFCLYMTCSFRPHFVALSSFILYICTENIVYRQKIIFLLIHLGWTLQQHRS